MIFREKICNSDRLFMVGIYLVGNKLGFFSRL